MLRHQDLIQAMTLQEKVSLLSGANFWNTKPIERLGIPSIMLTDGPHGLRKQAGKADHLGLSESVPATCFPAASSLAQSWDEELARKVGAALGAEAAGNQVGVLLGPGLNIVRDPLAGRAFEYFSEDPYVSGKMAAAMVRGIQSKGVAATPKHFAVNSQEHMRMSIDEVVDERTMREIYLEGFRRVVQEAKPKMLMTAYNKINGVYANEHEYLLKDILVDEWGYDGAIVTDWGGNHDAVAALKAGAGLEMPSTHGLTEAEIIQAVEKGTLNEAIIDERVDSLLALTFDVSEGTKDAPVPDLDMHHQLAAEAAQKSIVLLKNHYTLPLKKGAKIAVIGDFAKTPRYQGAGSSLVNPTQVSNALEALRADESVEVVGYRPGFKRTGGASAALIQDAVALADQADVAVVFLGLDESKEAEGIDRTSLQLEQNQLDLMKALNEKHRKIVVVISAGGPVELPFDKEVEAVLYGALAGQGGGQAIADVLVGKVNPSAKLTVTQPKVHKDTPAAKYFPGNEKTADHREGVYVGYRYYETVEKAVRYPFGHGLSYTKFEYGELEVNEGVATFSLTNTGKVAGDEITQVYVTPPKSGVFRPAKELKGFAKVHLKPGETKQVLIHFDEHTFAHYDVKSKSWQKVHGNYEVLVGASVQDIRTIQTVHVEGAIAAKQKAALHLPSYETGKITSVTNIEFERLLGRPLPSAKWNRRGKLGYDDTVAQLQYWKLRGRLFYGLLKTIQKVLFILKKPYLANNMAFVMNLPFSKIPGFTGGKVSRRMIEKFLGIARR